MVISENSYNVIRGSEDEVGIVVVAQYSTVQSYPDELNRPKIDSRIRPEFFSKSKSISDRFTPAVQLRSWLLICILTLQARGVLTSCCQILLTVPSVIILVIIFVFRSSRNCWRDQIIFGLDFASRRLTSKLVQELFFGLVGNSKNSNFWHLSRRVRYQVANISFLV